MAPRSRFCSGAAQDIIADLVRDTVAMPFAAALAEWRRTLPVPQVSGVASQVHDLPATAPGGPAEAASLATLTRLPAYTVLDPWALATASWLVAAAEQSQQAVQRVMRAVPSTSRRAGPRDLEPGTPLGDLQVLLSNETTDAAKLAALERTVARIRWLPRSPRVRQALAARAAPSGDVEHVKRQELRAAVYLVLAERGRSQVHRFGRSWLTDEDGRRASVVPAQLAPPLFWRWFRDEVRKAAEASLLGDAYPSRAAAAPAPVADAAGSSRLPGPVGLGQGGGEVGRAAAPSVARLTYLGAGELDDFADPSPEPVEILLLQEHRREAAQIWRSVLDEATPRQRQLLETLVQLADEATPAGALSLAEAARRLGMAPSTARVQWKRLLERLSARKPGGTDTGAAAGP